MSNYKRGTEIINGKRYGFYPDGSRFRIYDTDRPFIEFADVNGETVIRVRQATELGYAECPVGGCVDLAYPTSSIRRARTIGGGQTCQHSHLRTATLYTDRVCVNEQY